MCCEWERQRQLRRLCCTPPFMKFPLCCPQGFSMLETGVIGLKSAISWPNHADPLVGPWPSSHACQTQGLVLTMGQSVSVGRRAAGPRSGTRMPVPWQCQAWGPAMSAPQGAAPLICRTYRKAQARLKVLPERQWAVFYGFSLRYKQGFSLTQHVIKTGFPIQSHFWYRHKADVAIHFSVIFLSTSYPYDSCIIQVAYSNLMFLFEFLCVCLPSFLPVTTITALYHQAGDAHTPAEHSQSSPHSLTPDKDALTPLGLQWDSLCSSCDN